jgi:hypothetical protein
MRICHGKTRALASFVGARIVSLYLMKRGAKTNMVRLHGPAPRGRRLQAWAPFGHSMTTTIFGALRRDQITATCVFERPMNGPCFLAYIEQFPAPTLRQGDAVVRKAIERAGASLR